MKKIITAIMLIVLLFTMSACGYNQLMIEHLSNGDNYHDYTVNLHAIVYLTEKDTLRQVYKGDIDLTTAETVMLEVIFTSENDLKSFLGVYGYGITEQWEKYVVALELQPKNVEILCQNGFFNTVQNQEAISVKTSNWIYMDTDFFFVSQISYNSETYLNHDVGLQNIIDMMQQNYSVI